MSTVRDRQAEAGAKAQTTITITVTFGDKTAELPVDLSSTVNHPNRVIYWELHDILEQLGYPVHNSDLVTDVRRKGEESVLEDEVMTTSVGEPSETIYNGNTSDQQSTQINGPVQDGDGPPIYVSSGKSTYTVNASRGESLQVNGPVSSVDIFSRSRARKP